ncbi:MAG: DNA mismatch repair protein MutS [Phycisphaerae bacterium]|nr:DNA mismatch repair protein MutS [Phycisphaerae bacterium]
MAESRETPAMQQYHRFKRAHPGCILLFRIGDFYEMFGEDAVKVSAAIGLTLTARSEGQPMCGLPFHQLEAYLRKLIGAGFRVAVCEQLADASQVKGVIPRGVTRVVTPGTAVDESLLEGEAVSTLACVLFTGEGDESPASVAIVEVSTGDFIVADVPGPALIDELARRGVRELLYSDPGDGKAPPRVERLLKGLGIAGTARPSWQFRQSEALAALRDHFGIATLEGFGLRDDEPAARAAGAVVRYLIETQTLSEEDARTVARFIAVKATIKHLRPPRREDPSRLCIIDAVSLRSLEIERTMRGGHTADGSLLGIFLGGSGVARTAMGKRLLREYLCHPLRDRAEIIARQDAVAALVEDRRLSDELGESLSRVQDMARIAGRVAMGRCTPRDIVGLAGSLRAAQTIAATLEGVKALAPTREALIRATTATDELATLVLTGCVEAPPNHAREGGIFRDGFDAELDECRALQRDAGAWLSEYQRTLINTHNLPSLKVAFNSVFGYYIELPAAQARSAPAVLIRKQTLKNAERFTTPELREYEGKVMGAQARGYERERTLFAGLCEKAAGLLAPIAGASDAVARIDALRGFAEKAVRRGWKRPEVVEDPVLRIDQGRHPVLDEALGADFVPNDTELGGGHGAPLALITGPNMAGKSTYIRQTALIAILAHAGSFVPADRATIGLIDRVFTRIGADDALHAGQSTFMVEMIETANILNHATPRSLVVLDEVGRGTSTLDGLSLAWAIVEHLARANEEAPGPRTLFATHYHELTDLEERLPGKVRNLHVSVREWPAGDGHADIVFLRRILPGRTDQSYGLHVARLAGMPASVVARGREVLATLAVHHAGTKPEVKHVPHARAEKRNGQLGLFTEFIQHPAVDAVRELKVEHLSPMQAFDALRQIKEMVDAAR